jgi:hypothetical protein
MEARSTTGITVFITRRDATCGECGEELGRHAWITLDRERGASCLACAYLDHLVFLPAGDPALTRHARARAGHHPTRLSQVQRPGRKGALRRIL